jgi:uncharacterized protein YxjI
LDNRSEAFIRELGSCFIKQVKEWAEILVGVETKNKYEIYNNQKQKLGFAAELGKGLWSLMVRNILRSHRPIELNIWNNQQEIVFSIKRPFFWFFSELTISDAQGEVIGIAHRRFSLINKKYDLVDNRGRLVASIKSPFWRLWRFPVLTPQGQDWGLITKKWGGALKEIFTDTDSFKIDFPTSASSEEKALILGTAFTIDLDFFEDNVKRGVTYSWNN